MIFANVKAVEIPEGIVKQITTSNGTVLWKKSEGELPSEYKRVLDLTLTNARFVTDLYLTGGDTLKFSASGKAGNWIGAYNTSGSNDNYSFYATTTSSAKYLRYNGGTYNSSIVNDTRYDIIISPTGSKGNRVPETWTQQTFTCSVPLCIGATSPTGAACSEVTFYGNIVVEGSTKYIPCERVSDGVLGYYDTANGVFLTSSEGTVTTSGYDVALGPTVLYEDQNDDYENILIINEDPADRAANIALYGDPNNPSSPVVEEWPGLDGDHPYVFSSDNEVPWNLYVYSIKTVKVGSAVSPTSTAFWFYSVNDYAIGYTSFDLALLDTSNVTDMTYMFSFSGINSDSAVRNLNTSSATNMLGMFSDCNRLISIDISGWDTSNAIDMSGMFSNCEYLTTVNAGGLNTSSLEYTSEMFMHCFSLSSVDLSGWDTSNVTSMEMMFEQCSDITTIDLSSFDTSSVEDMDMMFYSCDRLQTIIASPLFVTTNVTEGSDMFVDCQSLVGGSGTAHGIYGVDDYSYACIDNPPSAPGYFTAAT